MAADRTARPRPGPRRWLALALGATVVALTGAAWLQRPADITAAEAVRAARGAFHAAGFVDVRVDPHPSAGAYDARGERTPTEVWKTTVVLGDREGTVELWVAREDGEAVFLDDRTADGTAQVLTDEQFRAVGDHVDNPAIGRQVRRDLLITLAAACILGLLVPLGLADRPLTLRPQEHP